MKRHFHIWVSYVLTFSLLGIVLIQFFFIQKEKQLLEQRVRYAVREALSQVENRIHEEEIHRLFHDSNSSSPFNRVFQDSLNRWTKEFIKNNLSAIPLEFSYDWSDSLITNLTTGKKDNLKRLYEKMLYDYFSQYLAPLPIQKRIDRDQLKKWFDESFRKFNIRIPYEFAVLDESLMTPVHSKNFRQNDPDYLYISIPLFDNMVSTNQYSLVVSVPKKSIYNSSLYYVAALGFFFVILLIAIYFYTIYQLIRQRYLAKMKTDFINNITHEFKTPIATMNLIVDTLRNPAVLNNPEQAKQYLQKLKEENKRMLEQVEKILMIGRIEQNRMVWNEDYVSLNETIEEAIEHMSLILEDHGGKIYFEPGAENDTVFADPMMLQRVFINFIDNAIKYTAKKPVIQIRTYNRGKFVVAEIKDNGIGMSKTVQKHIFDKFFRKPTGDIHNVKGHGVGLTLVKQVLDRMRAQIFVESEPGKGTTFYVYFPVRKEPN